MKWAALRFQARAGLISLFVLACAGCGYHTAGHTTTIPENVKTLAIPSFVNERRRTKSNSG